MEKNLTASADTDMHIHESKMSSQQELADEIVTIRSHSGLAGDMLLTGLAVLAMGKAGIEPGTTAGDEWLNKILETATPLLAGCVRLRLRMLEGIGGWHAEVNLPEAHEHRTLKDLQEIISVSAMSEEAKKLSLRCFELLANCEAFVHGASPQDIHFHEVGALDSILDICGVCMLYDILKKPSIICSPIPLADGSVECRHGVLPAPAPAVLQLLKGIPVRPFACVNAGELLTPTAAALLRTLTVQFGPWPAMLVQNAQLVYGSRTFPCMPNGATFVFGKQDTGIKGEEKVMHD